MAHIRVNVSIPTTLKAEMEAVRFRGNWSAVAAEAFTKVVRVNRPPILESSLILGRRTNKASDCLP